MTARFGPRFGAESAFIIAAAVFAYLLQFSLLGVAAVVFGAWLAVAVFEVFVARSTPAPGVEGDETGRPGQVSPPAPPAPAPVETAAEPPRGFPWPEASSTAAQAPAGPLTEDEPRAEPPAPPAEDEALATPEPEPEPEPEPAPEPQPEPAPAPEPEPAPAPPAPVRPPPEPEAALPPPPLPAAPAVAQRTPEGGWNLWELERVAREQAGRDPVRDEERSFLLMYLREFADADGNLAPHFDSLVRDSFPDLTGSVR